MDQLKKTCTPLTGIIYIDTPAEVCAERIKGRIELEKYQSSWIASINDKITPIIKTCSMRDVEHFINNVILCGEI